MHEREKWKRSRSVMSDSQWPHGLQPTRLLCPWDFPGKSTGVGCHCLRWVQLCGSLSILWHYLSLGFSIPYFAKWDNRDVRKLTQHHTASNRQDLDSNLDSMAILGRIQEIKPSGSDAAPAPSCFFLPQNKDMMLELQQPSWSHEVKGKKTQRHQPCCCQAA